MIVDGHLHIVERLTGYPPEAFYTSLSLGRVMVGHKVKERVLPYRDDGLHPYANVLQIAPPCTGTTSFSAEVALAYMDWVGVDKAILLQSPSYGRQNHYCMEAVYQWPDRFIGFAQVDPTQGEKAAKQLERVVVDGGLRGLKVEVPCLKASRPEFSIVGESEMLVWETCEKLGIPLFFHLEEGKDQCAEIRTLLTEFSKLMVIIGHLGLPPSDGWQDQCRLAKHERVLLDIAALPAFFREEEYPYPSAQECIRWAVSEVGADKIMWGSDAPMLLTCCTYEQTLNLVRTKCSFLTEEQRKLILGGTAERLIASLPI